MNGYAYTGLAEDLHAVIEWVSSERGVEFFIHRTNLRLFKLAVECDEPPPDGVLQSLKFILNHVSRQGLPKSLEDAFLNLARHCARGEHVTCP